MKHAVVMLACALALGQANAGPADPPINVPKRLTESQRILAKVMDDIRRCDKSIRYEYDSRTKQLSPPELRRIKGLRLKRLYRDIAVFEVNEIYSGLKVNVITLGRPNSALPWSIHTVAFRESFQTARRRLEQLWQLQLIDGLRPGPDVIADGLYADISFTVKGKERTLSIAHMPIGVVPHVGGPEVGCNHGE